MSALARYFHLLGKQVAGYDKTPSEITDGLSTLGVNIFFKENLDRAKSYEAAKEATLIVYTPAIPATHQELVYFRAHGFTVKKRSEILRLATQGTHCMAVAGTHGKTTTSTILAHLLKECQVKVAAFLGGISENFNSNFIYEGNEVTVVEADEFDRSFLQLQPNVACITSVDADHLDIYGEEASLQEAFQEFTKRLVPEGPLFVKKGLPLSGFTFAIEEDADYQIQNITIQNGTYFFDVSTPDETCTGVQFHQPGHHNLLNALAALAMASTLNIPLQKLADALESYKGVKRRFSYRIKTEHKVLIDDYAHHPTEIDAVYQAVAEMHPGKRTLAVFQPHLFSRTRDFGDDFGRSLSQFDEVLLLEIYPARELPISGITSSWLLNKIEMTQKALVAKEELPEKVASSAAEVVVMLGAGDIGNEVHKVKNYLSIAS